ncbi:MULTISPECIES: HipA family kinase [Flammeovirga]|uniref:Aminotransferase class I and II n=1 Tax=Flammeovirga agarivorans TaxID=2726742 RepID=A0A7X8XVS4_9BACT|nr:MULTISPECIES: HipA family kinase [Flammeovirga]NLR91576.1 aminotransferase class I and II [Flammeovirga agarivorans]
MYNREIRTVNMTRYVTPLREGGSLPAIVECDDGFDYVIKFRGAGQGVKALIAELLGGEMARQLDLNMPELVFIHLVDTFSKSEGDEEIQDLLKFSEGLNLGMSYLSGAITYDPLVSIADPLAASKVVLLDSIITNIDRTHRNTNLLNWNKALWVIDHGASLYFHHSWEGWKDHAQRKFPMIKDHVLLAKAARLEDAKSIIKEKLTPDIIEGIVNLLPDDWLSEASIDATPEERRAVYKEFLNTRIENIDVLTKEAIDARG